MSGDPEQGYFADGMAEDITTALSKVWWLSVAARNSAFAYKGKAVDVRRSAANSARAMCSRAACARPATRCGSRRSSSIHDRASCLGRAL